MSALMLCMLTVLGAKSRDGCLRSLGGYREVLNRVLTRVDLPRPDSPAYQLAHHIHNTRSSGFSTYQRP
jgi:hypothetical protein